jgi:iron complex outermembrane recepter protein
VDRQAKQANTGESKEMKTRTLRNAISIALLVAVTGTSEWAMAQDTATDTAIQGRAPVAKAQAKTQPKKSTDKSEATAATNLQTVTVTGTRIRGGITPSPVITIGSERIRQEGFTDLGQVVRSLPQNFTGGQNPGVLMGNVTGGGLANQNVTGGSGLNLRGLGPDASLTLLNGRRLAYGGFVQAVDISAIPVEAVEHVDIVADGASAIYGSDAVGGVGNVILRRDFDGVKVGARYGGATDGGLATREYTATAGTTWTNGGLIATYQDTSTDPIYARQRDYTEQLPSPTTIYPGSQLHSGLVSVHQGLGDAAELRLDALRTQREQSYHYFYGSTTTYQDLAPVTTSTFVSPSAEFFLPHDWSLTVGGSWGKDQRVQRQTAITVATGQGRLTSHHCDCNEIHTYELDAEGPLLELPAGDVRLAVGAGSRRNRYADFNYLTQTPYEGGDEQARFAYAELNLPLVSGDSGDAGAAVLAATAAARIEDYDSFGSVTTPKLGLVYNPSPDVSLKASWGKSFKAPTLYQRYSPTYVQLVNPLILGGVGYGADAIAFMVGGGGANLKPERARTYSATVAFHPQALPDLQAELSWFDIDYVDRVIEPITNYSDALDSPIYAEFVDYSPSPDALARYLAAASVFVNATSGPYDPDRVVAVLQTGYVNATRQRIKGVDLSGSYRFDVGSGQLTLRGATSWLDSTQQTAGVATDYDLSGTLFNPARLNGRIGVVWERGGLTASAFANYVGGVTDTSRGTDGASMTTFDTTVRYAMGDRDGAWSGVEFALTVSNLLDRKPPLYAPAAPLYVAPYDSTSYSAIGRFVSASIAKRW